MQRCCEIYDKMHFCKRYLAQFRRIEAGVESMKAPLLKRDTEAFRALQRDITIWWTYNQRDGALVAAWCASIDPCTQVNRANNGWSSQNCAYKPCFRGQFRTIAIRVDNSEGPPVKTRNRGWFQRFRGCSWEVWRTSVPRKDSSSSPAGWWSFPFCLPSFVMLFNCGIMSIRFPIRAYTCV